MKYVLPLLILINTHEIIGILEWTVTGKVTDYGQNVTLFCHVPNCCPKDAGWDRWTPVQQTLFIDVKTGRSNKKYDGKVMKDGYTLVIQNLTEQDLNVSYSCLYGVTLGEQKFLLEEDVFTRSPNSNSRFSVGEIAALIAGVVALVLVLIIIIEVWRRRKKRKPINSIKKQDSDTEMDKLITTPAVPSGPLSISNITDSSAFIEWQAPQNDGGAQVEEYRIEYQLVDETTWKTCEIVKNMIYKYCVKDLKEGQSYNFKVTASNRCGPGSSLESLQPTKLLEIPSVEETNRYMDALEAGKEHRQYVRIQVIGKNGVGKTTLVRKLLEDKHTEEVSSTDGIEIHQKCKIKQDGTWIICDVDSERDKIIERILHTVWKDQTQKGEQADSNEHGHTFELESTQSMQGRSRYGNFESMAGQPDEVKPLLPKHITGTNDPIGTALITDNELKSIQNCPGASNKNLVDIELHVEESDRINSDTSSIRKMDKIDMTKSERMNEDLNLKMADAIVKNMDGLLSYVKNKKDNMKSDSLVDCGIWDYAGQRDYYATHQTFLTSKAIYLLLVDIKDGITTFQDDMEFSFESIGRYIDFWLDSIHFHRDIQDTTAEEFRPPVIIVCTGIDKVGENREAKKVEYRKHFDKAFGNHNASKHIRGEIHFISNMDSPKKDFEELKTHISDIAKEMHFFEETLPTKWIELENALMVLKELKEEKMEYCETWENIVEIAKTVSIEKNELIDFLNYQHGIGNILFFENQSKYIILKPKWLVDCFRCLVCDEAKMNNCTKFELNQLTREGKITERVIDKLFRKAGSQFANMKPYILSVMEKFDIIVKQESANSYYIPCMVTSSSTIEDIKKEHKVKDEQCTPWLVFEFTFLPIAHYNHIIANYIKAYSQNGTLDLYAGMIVINLDKTNFRQLIVCFSRNAISLQIWQRNTVDDNKYRFIIEELDNEIEMLDKKLVHKLDYIIKAKCSDGYCFDKENRISYDDLTTKCEGGKYYCKEHSTNHESKKIEETWLKHVPAIEHEKKKKREEDEKEASEKQKREYYNEYKFLLQFAGTSEEFNQLLSAGTYESFENTVFLCGSYACGKSTLASVLIGSPIPLTWKSTDGIVIHIGRNGINLETHEMVPLTGEDRCQNISQPIISKIEDFAVHDDILQEVKRGRYMVKIASSDLVDVDGQRSYDMTRQLCIQPGGTFVVMIDGSRDFHGPLKEYPMGNISNESSVRHWVNSILTYCADESDVMPVILFAATHSDSLSEDMQKRIKTDFSKNISEMFGAHEMKKHIVFEPVFFINCLDKDDQEIKNLKNQLVRIAMNQPTWGIRRPMIWVPLELLITNMKKNNVNIVPKSYLAEANKINGDLALSDKQLDNFLLTQHVLGKIMYFNQPELHNFVILYPPELVNIMRSFLTDEMFWPEDETLRKILRKMTDTAKIYKKDLLKLWQQKNFHTHIPNDDFKEFVIQVLTHLDVLVIPKRYTGKSDARVDYFLVPCTVKDKMPMFFLDEKSFTNRTISLVYRFQKLSLPSALSFKLIGALSCVWPIMELNGRPWLYQSSAVLCVDEEIEFRIIVEDKQVVVYLTHMTHKSFISPDIATSIQEYLTSTLRFALKNYPTSIGKTHQKANVSNLFQVEVGEVCGRSPCVVSIAKAKRNSEWVCGSGNQHSSRYPLLWCFDKTQNECPHDCPGLPTTVLTTSPSEKHLSRFAARLTLKSCRELVINLGLKMMDWEDIEYSYRRMPLVMKVMALFFWQTKRIKEKPTKSFGNLQDALTVIGETRHLLCQVFRENTDLLDIADVRLQETPNDEVLEGLVKHLGDCAIQLGIELGVTLSSITETMDRHHRNMYGQISDILRKWTSSRNVKPTIYRLMLALERVHLGGLDYLKDVYRYWDDCWYVN